MENKIDSCSCPPEAGNDTCEFPALDIKRAPRAVYVCPVCGEKGKSVKGQTVKALLSVSLRETLDGEYLFCKTQTCPVVYFSQNGGQTFTVYHIRERVIKKNLKRKKSLLVIVSDIM